jgi:hypothetical protein
MDKLNISAIEEYSELYAKRLTNYFFIDNEAVSGKQILKFSDVQQVNLFTVGELFEAWQQETARMKSPYFDYESEEVKEALKVFMDTVSRFIAVRKEHFEPLLIRAVNNTLLLILSPVQYFEQWENTMGTEIFLDRLKDKLKYFHVNKFIPKTLIDRMEEIGQTSVPISLLLRWVNEIIETQADQLVKSEEHLDNFSRKLPIDVSAFRSATENSISAIPAFDNLDQEFQSDVSATYQQTVYLPEPVAVKETESVENKVEEKSELESIPPPVSKNISMLKASAVEVSLNDRFSRDQQTLNDTLKQVASKDPTLERHLKTRIENIKSAIPLNQKFVFINELFRGDTSAYHQALNELEHCDTYQSANELLMDKYARNYNWNMEGEEVQAFFEIIERKFY